MSDTLPLARDEQRRIELLRKLPLHESGLMLGEFIDRNITYPFVIAYYYRKIEGEEFSFDRLACYLSAKHGMTIRETYDCACEKLVEILKTDCERLQAPRDGEEQKRRDATHSEDFTSVTWYGTHYTFTKGLQTESVRILWEAWERGAASLSEKTIGDKAGSGNDRFRLVHVFKPTNKRTGKRVAHPAWDTMIKSVGKGVFALSPR